jgi:hypothetical protein
MRRLANALLLINFAAALQPLERYFFKNMSLVVVQSVTKSEEAKQSLEEMLRACSAGREDLLEMRILQPFLDPSTPSGDLNDATLVSWQLWSSVDTYLNRQALFNDPSLVTTKMEYYSHVSDTGGCHYCNQVKIQPVCAHFSNSQSAGAYPLLATFGFYLSEQTRNEIGTLDYTICHPLDTAPTSTLIDFNFDRIDFWEMYDVKESFDVHVVNVNNTLDPAAANWFLDLGSISTTWHQVLNYTSGCYKCTTSDCSSVKGESTDDDAVLSMNRTVFIVFVSLLTLWLILSLVSLFLLCQKNEKPKRNTTVEQRSSVGSPVLSAASPKQDDNSL